MLSMHYVQPLHWLSTARYLQTSGIFAAWEDSTLLYSYLEVQSGRLIDIYEFMLYLLLELKMTEELNGSKMSLAEVLLAEVSMAEGGHLPLPLRRNVDC